MSTDYQSLSFEYRPCPEQQAGHSAGLHPVIVVGAGPVGLAAAIDLAQQGISVVLVDDDCTLSSGSRAICFSKRSLDIFDRLGCGQPMVDKGVRWNVGKVFLQEQMVYSFDLMPESGHQWPAFINLQQYYVEGFLLDRARELPNIDIRWKNKVVGLQQSADGVKLTIETPDGEYCLQGRYVIAADGSRSPIRKLMGLDSKGRTFKDRFLIADVKMEAEFPTERWFWFDPPFHPNQSVLLHKQPDNVWRIDFQLGWDADPVLEKTPERVIPRVQALLGRDVQFQLEWVSVYTFSCLRMDAFRHGGVLFAGDSAHGVSPFGARGANSGIQDAENLAWKLAAVLKGQAPDNLLDSYAQEREYAADENIRNSTRSTDFITPKSNVSRMFRDATLRLAAQHPFARQLVNSGRLSVPAVLHDSALNTPDEDAFGGQMVPGASCLDAPLASLPDGSSAGSECWLLPQLGQQFTVLVFCDVKGLHAALDKMQQLMVAAPAPVKIVLVSSDPVEGVPASLPGLTLLHDADGIAAKRYDAQPDTCYLIRPDQHVVARWRALDNAKVQQALSRALGLHLPVR
ncbi:FAD-dependent oxidoreductase [Undibacterium terreum]|uniref:FAD-dependent oxidoreductase n=1 Tax=Undibacterium terreum TaxID=1224302 RepID=A0A916XC65_9BURK|nr:FAD-dependent oxidoreductase [Undibacterium terreum]GGC61001.1 FAD-dependent oxidoreductase [Undibacterium terreum]